MTLRVVAAGLALALLLGTLLGVLSTTRSRILRGISRVYVEFYQNTPLPVQVLFMYMAGPQFLQAITGAAQPCASPRSRSVPSVWACTTLPTWLRSSAPA